MRYIGLILILTLFTNIQALIAQPLMFANGFNKSVDNVTDSLIDDNIELNRKYFKYERYLNERYDISVVTLINDSKLGKGMKYMFNKNLRTLYFLRRVSIRQRIKIIESLNFNTMKEGGLRATYII